MKSMHERMTVIVAAFKINFHIDNKGEKVASNMLRTSGHTMVCLCSTLVCRFVIGLCVFIYLQLSTIHLLSVKAMF